MPIACLKNDKTTTILVNEVIKIKIAGAKDSTVNMTMILTTLATSVGVDASLKPREMLGIPTLDLVADPYKFGVG